MDYKFENKTIEVAIGQTKYKVILQRSFYKEGRIAIIGVTEDGEPFATLTVNLPESNHFLKDDEVFIKTWSENEEFAKSALRSGYFLKTGGRVQTGFVSAPIWLLIREGD